jgi:hypothetical protein
LTNLQDLDRWIKLVSVATIQPRRTVKRARKPATRRTSAVELYSPPRLALSLLENATDTNDYARARREVRSLGIDPDRVPHDPSARS